MGASATQIATVRRMIAEPTTTTYTDAIVTAAIESHPLFDENGEEPTYLDYSTEPPTATANDDWIPTYDLNAAAADLWEQKAASLAANFDFSADGGSYQRSQAYEMAMKQARHFRSRASGESIRMHMHPTEYEGLEE